MDESDHDEDKVEFCCRMMGGDDCGGAENGTSQAIVGDFLVQPPAASSQWRSGSISSGLAVVASAVLLFGGVVGCRHFQDAGRGGMQLVLASGITSQVEE